MQACTDATVLVVDDEPAVLEAFALYLESADNDVRTVANGGEALTELGPEVDLALLDRRMPGMPGTRCSTTSANGTPTVARRW